MLRDSFHRNIEYVRLSVTDLCNIRCRYCMPVEGVPKTSKDQILSFEEIHRLIRILVELGVRSVRITGGEPLVRKDLPKLLSQLNSIPALEDLCLTTNGIHLEEHAEALFSAGLKRINIHLDTLDSQRFRHITRWGELDKVLLGIQRAQNLGMKPIKLNAVLLKGFNDDEVVDLVRFAAEKEFILRFIELMPIGPGLKMKSQYLETQFVLDKLSEQYTLIPYGKRLGRGPAEYYQVAELGSVVGFIHPVSQPFCDKCNRIRISSEGRLQDCLAYQEPWILRDLLRAPGLSDDKIKEAITRLLMGKREDHGGFLRSECTPTQGMYGIGG
ncbi:MAG: GTP 3',8-cyclase MoaA [bacterium]|nr:GTP 3',8-cyclase MoaA [bacterium]